MKPFNNEDHLLSSFLDQELTPEQSQTADQLVKEQFEAQVQYRNMNTVSKACQENLDQPADFGGSDFLGGIFAQIENLEQDNPAEDTECLSAWVDAEFELTDEEVAGSEIAVAYQEQTQLITAALQELAVPELSTDFAEQVMQRIELASPSDAFAPIANALRDLPVPALSEDFADKVMSRVETQLEQDFSPVSLALQSLQVPELSQDFAARVLSRIESENTQQEDDFAPVAEALKNLSVPEISSDFVLRVMMATEKLDTTTQKAKLFALPTFWQQRWGQMVAAVAAFGVLVFASQSLLQSPQATVAQNVPSDIIVQVQYAPEAELFDDVMNTSLEATSDDDYNLLIGG